MSTGRSGAGGPPIPGVQFRVVGKGLALVCISRSWRCSDYCLEDTGKRFGVHGQAGGGGLGMEALGDGV